MRPSATQKARLCSLISCGHAAALSNLTGTTANAVFPPIRVTILAQQDCRRIRTADLCGFPIHLRCSPRAKVGQRRTGPGGRAALERRCHFNNEAALRPRFPYRLGACSCPLPQGLDRLTGFAASLGVFSGFPIFPRFACAKRAIPLPKQRPIFAKFPDPLRQRAEADGRHRLRLHVKEREKQMKKARSTAARVDIYDEVTTSIIALLEAGTRPWSPSWASGEACLPKRYEGSAYRGINIILLWVAAMQKGYSNPHWMTYRQAAELGGQVRKGEKGNLVVHAGTFTPRDGETGEPMTLASGEQEQRHFLKRYTVFNVEQIDGLDLTKFPTPVVDIQNRDQRDSALDAAFDRYPVHYVEQGMQALYDAKIDRILMPKFSDFVSGNAFYATLAHEAIHSTGHASRLNRDTLTGYSQNVKVRANEELIAEIGAAMLCAQLGMEPTEREDHAAYVAEWLTILKEDKRAIFRAASAAQAASEMLLSYLASQPVKERELA